MPSHALIYLGRAMLLLYAGCLSDTYTTRLADGTRVLTEQQW